MQSEDFVTFDQAKILKELNFDWGCNHWYHTDDEFEKKLISSYEYSNHSGFSSKALSAPTLYQTQKWLREKGYHIYIIYEIGVDENEKYFNSWRTHVEKMYLEEVIELDEVFSTYEDALSSGINKALEFIKNN